MLFTVWKVLIPIFQLTSMFLLADQWTEIVLKHGSFLGLSNFEVNHFCFQTLACSAGILLGQANISKLGTVNLTYHI